MGSRIGTVIVGVCLLAVACSDGGTTDLAAPTDDAPPTDDTEPSGDTPPTDDTEPSGDTEPPSSSTTTATTAPPSTSDPSADDDDRATDDDAATDDGSDDEPLASITLPDGPAGEPLALPYEPSEQGDNGRDVVALQERLGELGFAPGSADGSYGRRTTEAVAAFQTLLDLEPTGMADRTTIIALTTYRYDGLILHAGDEGDDVEELQLRLAGGPFDPGPIDGSYGTATVQAVWALEKLAGVPVDGDWGPLDEHAWQALQDGEIGRPEQDHEQRWVEVDLSEQLMKVYDPGETTPTLISHASSGSGVPWSNEEHSGSSITPTGDFHINRRISGWRESSLNIGRLYNPLYFNGGIAFHGATSVPRYPASHGCIRLPMHVAEYLPAELPNGTPVHVMA